MARRSKPAKEAVQPASDPIPSDSPLDGRGINYREPIKKRANSINPLLLDQLIVQDLANGFNGDEIARKFQIARSTVFNRIKKGDLEKKASEQIEKIIERRQVYYDKFIQEQMEDYTRLCRAVMKDLLSAVEKAGADEKDAKKMFEIYEVTEFGETTQKKARLKYDLDTKLKVWRHVHKPFFESIKRTDQEER